MTQLKKTIGPLLLVFILCVAPLAADSWRTTYAKAEKAVKKKAWSKAIDYIR
ncbi:MAG: hypothetical protein GY765_08930, partial [bacterium]|nr:hypothetical protein [bacterium]